MPLEVSPAPFLMQLPYTPKFVPETAAAQPGSLAGSAPHGPASAAASAIIPPNPGGIATPHQAIPALADAGYTSTSLRPRSIVFEQNAHQGMYGPQSAGGSLYDHPAQHQLHQPHAAQSVYHSAAGWGTGMPMRGPLSTIHSDGWGTSSLPAPRPARIQTGDNTIAPSRGHHHHSNNTHSHAGAGNKGRYDDDDAKSDASYYARPRMSRHHSASVASSRSSSRESSPTEHRHQHHRSGSTGHRHRPSGLAHGHHRSPSLVPAGPASYSPGSPSPLSMGSMPNSGGRRRRGSLAPESPLSPERPRLSSRLAQEIDDSETTSRRHERHQHERDDRERRDRHASRALDDVDSRESMGQTADLDPDHHSSRERPEHARRVSDKRHAGSHHDEDDPRSRTPKPDDGRRDLVDDGRPRHSSGAQQTSKRDRHASLPPSSRHEGGRENHESSSRRQTDGHHRESGLSHRHRPRSKDGSDRGYSSDSGSQPKSRRVHSHHHQHDDHSHHHHREHQQEDEHRQLRHRFYESVHLHPEDRHTPRLRSHSHSHHPPGPPAYAQTYGRSSPPPGGMHPHVLADPYRRRAVSMQFDQGPGRVGGGGPMSALGAPGPGDGTRAYGASVYQTPSVVGGPAGDNYDDGASIAGSGMTFMDGPVGGRTSQYGLPKYAHQMKPDYRRFMVQRGNADVFLD